VAIPVMCLKAALVLIQFSQKQQGKARKMVNLVRSLRYRLERLELLERFERFSSQMRAVCDGND
jgi:hypothetical protein